MDTEIEMIRTEEGKNMIERTEIENYMHKEFKKKFQTKREELNKLPNIELDDTAPEITHTKKQRQYQ